MITPNAEWQETTPMASHYLLKSFLVIFGLTFCAKKLSANQNSEGFVEWDQRSLKRREFNWLNSVNPLSPNISTYKCSSLMHFLNKKVESICLRIKILVCLFISLVLITFSLSYVSMLLGENWCWSLLGRKGLKVQNKVHLCKRLTATTRKQKKKNLKYQRTVTL